MDEKILIKKDGYLNIQKNESDGRVSINITVEPVCHNEQKFKPGDKVRIKDGISSKTHFFVEPSFTNRMNEFIGRKLTVNGYVPGYGYVNISESVYNFHEDWLELYKEEKQKKFKPGDKVRIKNGISSKTHKEKDPGFLEDMDIFIGETLIVKGYDYDYDVIVNDGRYVFNEDWLELVDELKVGDWVIAWNCPGQGTLGILDIIEEVGTPYYVSDKWYMNAVKWDDVYEQLEKVRRGEL